MACFDYFECQDFNTCFYGAFENACDTQMCRDTQFKKQWSRAVFFNLGSAEPLDSLKIFLVSANYLKVSVCKV